MLDICINGKNADITLESERTVGELLSGIDQWLQNSGFRLTGLEIDGEIVDSGAVPLVFGRELEGLRILDIKVSSGLELALAALSDAVAFLDALETADPAAVEELRLRWDTAAAASFLRAEFPELYWDMAEAFNGPLGNMGVRVEGLKTLIGERIREISDPLGEVERSGSLIGAVTARLGELSLDIQCGRDLRAAETVALFSALAEKLFRLYNAFKNRGEDFGGVLPDSLPMKAFLDEFSAAITEMLSAYQGRDLVLVGDLAEYELAPRLPVFWGALKTLKDRS